MLIAKIKEYIVVAPHSLWDVLLEELESCVKSLTTPYRDIFDTPNIMTQHAGYLGRMRGLPGRAASQLSPDLTHLTRGFSNSIQRQISAGLASQVTPVAINSPNISPLLSSVPINDIDIENMVITGTPFSPQLMRHNGTYTPLHRS